ncbi:hypothetical protein EOM57_05715 [Candidatus Saccharibacteria bacterium]|nr:hypothetical protein [Candidatus Saccharibacteria bacterium]
MVDLNSFFKDSCVIKRSKGTVNSLGNEEFDDVYTSVCTLQVKDSGGAIFRDANWRFGSAVIMPYTTTDFKINDLVEVETFSGRSVSSTIENFNSYNWMGIQGTVIWLKQGKDEQ